ncbi:MAG TPA: Hsp20/alpha crystallin family protein [Saprospiraceae bacterium]|nr:Hsp20/alpha crystallin family protein [Saprospiraceae bacterium]
MNTLLMSPFAYRIRPNVIPQGYDRFVHRCLTQDAIPNVKNLANKISRPFSNIKKTEDAYELYLSVPGFTKENIKISTDQDLLHIEGTMEEMSSEDYKYNHKEFGTQNFKRSFRLPEFVNYDNITAQCKDGILLVKLGFKAEEAVKSPVNITID